VLLAILIPCSVLEEVKRGQESIIAATIGLSDELKSQMAKATDNIAQTLQTQLGAVAGDIAARLLWFLCSETFSC
jgi:hypothetical protein